MGSVRFHPVRVKMSDTTCLVLLKHTGRTMESSNLGFPPCPSPVHGADDVTTPSRLKKNTKKNPHLPWLASLSTHRPGDMDFLCALIAKKRRGRAWFTANTDASLKLSAMIPIFSGFFWFVFFSFQTSYLKSIVFNRYQAISFQSHQEQSTS